MNKFFLALMLTILLSIPNFAFSQEMFNKPAPIDTSIVTGKLENGLTYYIKHNEEPAERVSFYIIQNVGALLEEDNQNGLAHFLEHMAFNGTEHYPGKGIINFLEKNGVAFGRNINAYTAFNETVYNISNVPSGSSGLLDSCLLVLHDWSNYLLLTEEEIDAERGVISEEWRTRRNASFRLRNQSFPVIAKDSKYAVRDVIGDLDIIQNFDYETIRQFYHDWYRTDLQAIAIVGDINPQEIEEKVKKLFSHIPAVVDAKPRPFFEIPEHKETYYVLATDKEATSTSISVYMIHKGVQTEDKNQEYIRSKYVQTLFNRITGDRMSELVQKGELPFVSGSISIGNFVRGYEVGYFNTTPKPNEENKALQAIYTEAQRIIRHGLTESELERAKINLLTSMESSYKQRDKISNDRYVRGIQNHFLTGEPLTTAEFDWEFAQKVIPGIRVEELNALANEYFVDENRVVVISGPDGDEIVHLKKEEVLAIFNEVENTKIDPYVDSDIVTNLITEELKGSPVVSTKKLEQFDAVEWTLANNATVVFKHADFDKDAVTVQAYSPGGISVLPVSDLPASRMLSSFVNNFGIGDLDAIQFKKALTGKKARVSVSMGSLSEMLYGNSTPQDFETLMQILYLRFTNPRFDQDAYDALKSRYIASFENMDKDPQKMISDSISMIFSDYSERTILTTNDIFDHISLSKLEEIYIDRIQDAGDFNFYIVGNIDENTAKEMASKYIGSIPDIQRDENWINHHVDMPKGKTVKEINIPLETEKASVVIRFKKAMPYSPDENLKIDVLKSILRLRYMEEIREKEGGTYGVSVSSGASKYPDETKTLEMRFDADAERADHLKSLIYKEIDKIVENGPTEVDLDKVVKNMLKDREQSKNHNNYWSSTIYNFYNYGYNSNDPANYEEVLDGLTSNDIKKFAVSFFDSPDIVDLIFRPSSL
jgi:zinc protease